jgi:hypothetical protein
MLKPKILSAALVLMPAVILMTGHSSVAESTSNDCKSGPGSSAPPGMHWYYRVDRANSRHCWYLHSQGVGVHSHADLTSQNPNSKNVPGRPEPILQTGALQPAPQQAPDVQMSAQQSPLDFGMREESVAMFAARWVELPRSADLDRRETAGVATSYAAEQTTVKAEEDLPPAWSDAPTANGGARPAAQTESSFASISILGAALLTLLLLSEAVVKLLRRVAWISPRLFVRATSSGSAESGLAIKRAGYSTRSASGAADDPNANVGFSELRGVLRRADSGQPPPRSFAPSPSTRKQPTSTAQHFGGWTRIRKHVRAHSAFQRLKTRSLTGPRWAPL